jgi:hypothetical protein
MAGMKRPLNGYPVLDCLSSAVHVALHDGVYNETERHNKQRIRR